MGYVLALLVLLWTTMAVADDELLKRMELEAQLRQLGRQTAEAARFKVDETAKQTSLWKEYRATQEKLKTAMARNKCRPPHLKEIPIELRYEELCVGRFRTRQPASARRDAVIMELRDEAIALGDDLNALREKFGREIYWEEMRQRLQELKVEMTEELQHQLGNLYKRGSPSAK